MAESAPGCGAPVTDRWSLECTMDSIESPGGKTGKPRTAKGATEKKYPDFNQGFSPGIGGVLGGSKNQPGG